MKVSVGTPERARRSYRGRLASVLEAHSGLRSRLRSKFN